MPRDSLCRDANSIRVFLVEDHEIVRASLMSMLKSVRDVTIVGEAASGREALDRIPGVGPDIVLLDYGLPDMTGAEVCRKLAEMQSATRVIILSASMDEGHICAGLMAGADAYVIKDAAVEALMETVRAAAAGESRVNPHPTDRVMSWNSRSGTQQLTPAFRRVLRLACEGRTNAEVAFDLGISKNTVKGYFSRIYAVLGVSGRTQAISVAKRRGLI